LCQKLPACAAKRMTIAANRQKIRDILDGFDRRLLLIIGPCSIHDLESAKEYAIRLSDLSQSISSVFSPVMRVYFEKPRTVMGWKGFLYDPHLDGSHQIALGLHLTRQFLLEIAEIGIATATEFLDLTSQHYYGDLISWGCIGARTAESQLHRQM